jgi:predicted NAD/FAD-binding protein
MNKLQAIPMPSSPASPGRVLVTMNPVRVPQSVQSSQVYSHPLITADSILMTQQLDKIKDAHVSFAGAWMGFGFHKDGFRAGTHAQGCQ